MSHNHDDSDTDRLADVHSTRSLPFGLFSKSPLIRSAIVAAIDKNQRQIAETAVELVKLTAVSLFLWWSATEVLAPIVADRVGLLLWFGLNLFVGILPAIGVICGMVAVVHIVWYGHRRWNVRPAVSRGEN